MLTYLQTRTFVALVALSWVGLVFYLGTVRNLPNVPWASSGTTASLGHFATHAVLASLIYLIIVANTQTHRRRVFAIAIAFGLTVLVGLTLEVVQFFVPYRAAEASDILFDAFGALTGALAVFIADQLKIHRALLATAFASVVLAATSYIIVDAVTAPAPLRFANVEECNVAAGISRADFTPTTSGSDISSASKASVASGRITNGLVALYTFSEGFGDVVHDTSGLQPKLDLSILDTSRIRWLPDANGVEFIEKGSAIRSESKASKIIDRLRTSGSLTIEAWVLPNNLEQGGPVRIVTLSEGWHRSQVNVHLGQQKEEGSFRLRTNCEAFRWTTYSDSFTSKASPTHIVGTYDGSGMHMTINGVPREISESQSRASGKEVAHEALHPLQGDFSNWNKSYPLIVGNELKLDRSFLGKIFLIAIYDRTLPLEEIAQNFQAGPG